MSKIFVDKNIIFHYLRKILFHEQVPLSSLQIIKCVHNNKLQAVISENALFGLINYCIYKLERDFDYDLIESEKKAKEKIKFLLRGSWEIKSLELKDFQSALEENTIPFEDYCQYLCAKKENILLITHNVDDFLTVKDVKILKPRDFIEACIKRKELTKEDTIYPY